MIKTNVSFDPYTLGLYSSGSEIAIFLDNANKEPMFHIAIHDGASSSGIHSVMMHGSYWSTNGTWNRLIKGAKETIDYDIDKSEFSVEKNSTGIFSIYPSEVPAIRDKEGWISITHDLSTIFQRGTPTYLRIQTYRWYRCPNDWYLYEISFYTELLIDIIGLDIISIFISILFIILIHKKRKTKL